MKHLLKLFETRSVVLILAFSCYPALIAGYYLVWLHFDYMGFDFSFELLKSCIALASVLSILLIGTLVVGGFYRAVWNILFVYLLLPTIIYYQFNEFSFKAVMSLSILLLMIAFVSRLKIQFQVPKLVIAEKLRIYAVFGIVAVMLAPFFPYLKYVDLSNLLFINVYETRVLFREVEAVAGIGYVYGILTRVLLPILMVYALDKRNWIIFTTSLIGLLYLFLLGALKSVFFGFILALVFRPGTYAFKTNMFLGGVISLCVIGYFMDVWFGNYWLVDGFIRRIFFTPSMLESVYYTEFDSKFLYWSHTIIGQLFTEYEYSKAITYYVGEDVLNDEGNNASIGVMTEGFISSGFIGVFVHASFISSVLIILNGVRFPSMYFGIVVLFLYAMRTSFVLPLLASHALFAFLIVAVFFTHPAKPSGVK